MDGRERTCEGIGFGRSQLHRDQRVAEPRRLSGAYQDLPQGSEGIAILVEKLIDCGEEPSVTEERNRMNRDAQELMNIFGAVVRRAQNI